MSSAAAYRQFLQDLEEKRGRCTCSCLSPVITECLLSLQCSCNQRAVGGVGAVDLLVYRGCAVVKLATLSALI